MRDQFGMGPVRQCRRQRTAQRRFGIAVRADNAETRLGNLIAQQETLQQQLAFATQVESARIVTKAAAVKSSPRSKTSSLLIGALIGLLLGAIAAIVVDARH